MRIRRFNLGLSRSPSRAMRRSAVAAVGLLAVASSASAAEGNVCIENATLAELQDALTGGRTTASTLTRAYLARIEAYDRAGPRLNSVRELNPDALSVAASLDNVK